MKDRSDSKGRKSSKAISFYPVLPAPPYHSFNERRFSNNGNNVPLSEPRRIIDLVNAMPEVLAELDHSGRIIFLNHAGATRLGIFQKDLNRGIRLQECMVPKDRERAEALIRQAAKGRTTAVDQVAISGLLDVSMLGNLCCFPITSECGVASIGAILTFDLGKNYCETGLQDITGCSGQELKARAQKQEKVSAALRIIVKTFESEKKRIEANIMSNVHYLIYPLLLKLKRSDLPEDLKIVVNLIETNLTNITSSFSMQIEFQYIGFTPTEMRVANLIMHGWNSKEIAHLLNLSLHTIENHRKHIRSKLGLRHKRFNIREFLLSLYHGFDIYRQML